MRDVDLKSLRQLGAELVFDLRQEAPELYALFRRQYAGLANIAGALERRFPVTRTWAPFVGRRFVRPRYHFRTFYWSASNLPRRVQDLTAAGDGVLAFKGTEPLAEDIDDGLARQARHRLVLQTRPNHFALHERKVPLAVSVGEVLTESRIGLEVQRAHVVAYGELARLPLPLLGLRWPSAVSERHRHRVERFLTPKSCEQLDRSWREGLGTFCYAYPVLPVRVSHWVAARPVRSMDSPRFQVLEEWLGGSPLRIVEGWLRTTARLACLGYLPCSLENTDWTGRGRGLGQACNPNNAVMDGGFADIDSIVPLRAIQSLADMFLSAELTVRELLGTVRLLLLGAEGSEERGDYDAQALFLARYVHEGLLRLLRSEARRGARPDPRLTRYLQGDEKYARAVMIAPERRGLSFEGSVRSRWRRH